METLEQLKPAPDEGRLLNARRTQGKALDKPVILVVDDDPDLRSYLCVLLTGRGYEVIPAASGDEALPRLMSAPTPAVVLLDLVMPGVGGLEVLERIKQTRPQIPVVILSTVGQIRTVVEAMSRGASDYLTKPFQEAELGLAIENALEKQRLHDEVKVLRHRLDQYREPSDLVSLSHPMQHVRDIARQVADSDAPVLLLGETGV